MKNNILIIAVIALFLMPFMASQALAELRLGVGANYWTAVDDIDIDNVDDDGMSFFASVQIPLAELAAVEILVERFDEGFGGSPDAVYAPQAFFILGGGIYAGAGIGVYYTDDEFADDPFFALRAGFNLELLPNIYLDINANYRFENWDDVRANGLDNVDEDTITIGAAARIEI